MISLPDSFAPAGAAILADPDPRLTPWAWSLDVSLANSNESTAFAHRNKPLVPQRMAMSTKRLFHYKQEMRAFDW
ncbi:MAG: hypothetical protein DMG05_19155 [Acidobacteria bacterium]|nr:MAG: hypothetical protein DMG05_19155 [Acidobacteriota bacterium]